MSYKAKRSDYSIFKVSMVRHLYSYPLLRF
jgi:hypothetical protein